MLLEFAIAVSAVFLVAGFVKGFTGMGLPTVAVAGLSLFLPASVAATLLLVPSLLTNVWQFFTGAGTAATFRRHMGLIFGIVLGAAFSFMPTIGASGPWAKGLTGVVLLAYGLVGLCKLRLPTVSRHERWVGPIVGYLTGAITVSSGIFVLPSVPYLQSIGLAKDELVKSLGLTFTVCTLCLSMSLSSDSKISGEMATASLALLVPAVAGMSAGAWLRGRVSEEVFKRYFFAALLTLGGYMVYQAAGLR